VINHSFAAHMRAQGHAQYTDEYVERIHLSIDLAERRQWAKKHSAQSARAESGGVGRTTEDTNPSDSVRAGFVW